jgi:hypothetical protein
MAGIPDGCNKKTNGILSVKIFKKELIKYKIIVELNKAIKKPFEKNLLK